MRYLITGGCGFLGSNLAYGALQRGHELAIFDNISRLGSQDNFSWLQSKGKFAFYHGDIRSPHDIYRCIKDFNPDVIFHLAGQVAMTTSIDNPRLDFEINGLGSLNVLEAVRNIVPSCTIVYSSTNKVYGDLEWVDYTEGETRYFSPDYPLGFDENIPLDFHSPYGCSKGCADQYMLDYHRIFGLNTVVFRHSSMYGGRQFSSYDQGWIGWFCQKAMEIKNKTNALQPFTISGSGKQVRDVLHADDMVNLYFVAAEKIEATCGKAYNIGGGMDNSLSLLELFDFLERELDVKMGFQRLEPRESDQKIFVANHDKITRATGWSPKVGKETGLRMMLDWCERLN